MGAPYIYDISILRVNVYTLFRILMHVVQAYKPATSSCCCMTKDVFEILKEGMLQRFILLAYSLPDSVTAVVGAVSFSLAHLSARNTGYPQGEGRCTASHFTLVDG